MGKMMVGGMVASTILLVGSFTAMSTLLRKNRGPGRNPDQITRRKLKQVRRKLQRLLLRRRISNVRRLLSREPLNLGERRGLIRTLQAKGMRKHSLRAKGHYVA